MIIYLKKITIDINDLPELIPNIIFPELFKYNNDTKINEIIPAFLFKYKHNTGIAYCYCYSYTVNLHSYIKLCDKQFIKDTYIKCIISPYNNIITGYITKIGNNIVYFYYK